MDTVGGQRSIKKDDVSSSSISHRAGSGDYIAIECILICYSFLHSDHLQLSAVSEHGLSWNSLVIVQSLLVVEVAVAVSQPPTNKKETSPASPCHWPPCRSRTGATTRKPVMSVRHVRSQSRADLLGAGRPLCISQLQVRTRETESGSSNDSHQRSPSRPATLSAP
jgi:hypothetical protein